jgi:hypothetical protein
MIGSHPFNWIWQVRGMLPLPPGQLSDEAFNRLDPLFREGGTTRERRGNTLTFHKQDPAAQDRMSVFDAGTLQIEPGAGGAELRYQLTSRFLLFSFLAPLLFLAFAGLTVAAAKLEGPPSAQEREKEEEAKNRVLPQHSIDKFLGAPAPEKPKKDDKVKKDSEAEDDDKRPKPTAAYVLAAMFAVLYAVGRVLEGRLVKSLFRKSLLGS